MYQILKNGQTIGYAEKPNYICRLDNGSWGLCTEREAEAIAFDEAVYPLQGKAEIDGAQTVLVTEVDRGRLMEEIQAKNAASIDYLSMMAGIDLPEEGETNGTQPEV